MTFEAPAEALCLAKQQMKQQLTPHEPLNKTTVVY